MPEITIAEGETDSDSTVLHGQSGVFVGIETPATITSTEFTIMAKSQTDGTWRTVQKDGADYVVPATASALIPLRPDLMAPVRELKVVGDDTEAQDVVLNVIVRDID